MVEPKYVGREELSYLKIPLFGKVKFTKEIPGYLSIIKHYFNSTPKLSSPVVFGTKLVANWDTYALAEEIAAERYLNVEEAIVPAHLFDDDTFAGGNNFMISRDVNVKRIPSSRKPKVEFHVFGIENKIDNLIGFAISTANGTTLDQQHSINLCDALVNHTQAKMAQDDERFEQAISKKRSAKDPM